MSKRYKLSDVLSFLADEVFDMTLTEAHEKGICIQCKKPAVFRTDAGRKEWKISGICEVCFDDMCQGE